MKKRIFILAESYKAYQVYLRNSKLFIDISYLHEPSQLRGLRGSNVKIYRIGDYRNNPNYFKIKEEMELRKMEFFI